MSNAAQVNRLSSESPEPSATVTPSIGTPHDCSVAFTTASPAMLVPEPPFASPISFRSISAVLLSLVTSISLMIDDSGLDRIEAIVVALVERPDLPTLPIITKRSCNSLVNTFAAPIAGSLAALVSDSRESFTNNPAIGPASTNFTSGVQLGAYHSSS
ncbi:MAG: hypothetical protein F2919_07435 [Actinobacteria bacterium]|nr:hypothetical protein [Actinomycetota bacterium]